MGGQLETHACASMTVPIGSVAMAHEPQRCPSTSTASHTGRAKAGPDDGARLAYGEYADLA